MAEKIHHSPDYDAMGNSVSYLGQTLTWEGKQLTAAGTNTSTLTTGTDCGRRRPQAPERRITITTVQC